MLLELRDLEIHYPGRPALGPYSLSLAAGQTLGLLGPSGAGKSTLARCIAGRESYQQGQLKLDANPQLVPQEPSESLNPLLSLAPNQGCKGVILAHSANAHRLPCPEAEIDIDIPADYTRL